MQQSNPRSQHIFLSGWLKFDHQASGKQQPYNQDSTLICFKRIYDSMVNEEKFCVIKPYHGLVPPEQASKLKDCSSNQLTMYLFPIRSGSTEYNKELNKQLQVLDCLDQADTSFQLGFFATIKNRVILRKNFLNPQVLELKAAETPTKASSLHSGSVGNKKPTNTVKSILKAN